MAPRLNPVAISGAGSESIAKPSTESSARPSNKYVSEVRITEAALQAWTECEPEGNVLAATRISALLPRIAALVPGGMSSPQRSQRLCELFRPDWSANPQCRSFLQRLNAEGGMIHFLYFWRSFSEIAHIVCSTPEVEGESSQGGAQRCETEEALIAEVAVFRDKALRLLRVRLTKKELDDKTNSTTSFSRTIIATSALADAIRCMAAKSVLPDFWQVAASNIVEHELAGSLELNLEQLTGIILVWLDSAITGLWDVGSGFEAILSEKDLPKSIGSARGSGARRCKINTPKALEAAPKVSARPSGLPGGEPSTNIYAQVDAAADIPNDTGMPVYLNIYDAFHDKSISWINSLLAPAKSSLKFGGAFHAGLEVNGLEWSYGCTTKGQSGVAWNVPRIHKQHRYRQSLCLGVTQLSEDLIMDVLTDLFDEYRGDDYHMLRRNCCHFADDFSQRLGVAPVPQWVYRVARIAANADVFLQTVSKAACSCSKIERAVEVRDERNCNQWVYRL